MILPSSLQSICQDGSGSLHDVLLKEARTYSCPHASVRLTQCHKTSSTISLSFQHRTCSSEKEYTLRKAGCDGSRRNASSLPKTPLLATGSHAVEAFAHEQEHSGVTLPSIVTVACFLDGLGISISSSQRYPPWLHPSSRKSEMDTK